MLEPFIPAIIISSGRRSPFALLPDLVGMNSHPSDHLLLALNHDELRGGGGFDTATGTATINSLVNIDLELQESYRVDDVQSLSASPATTAGLYARWYLGAAGWQLVGSFSYFSSGPCKSCTSFPPGRKPAGSLPLISRLCNNF